MSGINNIFEMGRLGIQAFQRGLSVTAHNITNASTEGFSRQDVALEAQRPLGGVIPSGVRVAEVRRNVDLFVEAQLTDTTQDFGRLSRRHDLLLQVESIFSEGDDLGVTSAVDQLFNAFRDLSTFPEGSSQRTLLLSDARTLADTLNRASSSLTRIRTDIDSSISRNLTDVNNLATQIASLNERIQLGEANGENANDLRDKRAVAITSLAELVNIETVDMTDGTAVMVGGQLLLSGKRSNSLVQVSDPSNPGLNDVALQRRDGTNFVITDKISQGIISGQLTVRDTDVVGYLDRLDRTAAVLVNEINQQHAAGYGLDGTTGNLLFTALSPDAPLAKDTNTGGAAGTSTSILTASSLTMDTYEIQFTNATTFNVVNVTDGTTALSAQTYTSGNNIDFDGLRVVITDSSGAPAASDVFTVSAHKGAAADLSVSLTNGDKVAASSTAAGVPGNNINALALVAIQTTSQSTLSNIKLNDYHAVTVGNVGSDVSLAALQRDAKQVELDQVKSLRESISGVSLDEELTHLLEFQRAFEASARVITTADELFQTVLTLGL